MGAPAQGVTPFVLQLCSLLPVKPNFTVYIKPGMGKGLEVCRKEFVWSSPRSGDVTFTHILLARTQSQGHT